MEANLISALKRKNVKDILEIMLKNDGDEAGAKEVREASRLTNALIDRVCIPSKKGATTPDSEEEEEGEEEQATTTTPDAEEEGKSKKGKDKKKKSKKDEPETKPEPEEEEESEEDAPKKLTVGEIKDLVATGKKKKIKQAKEAFKAQFAKDHPNYKELKALFKKD